MVAQRRVVFLKHIMERHDDEILKKVFLAQKSNPTKGDFAQVVEKDWNDLKVTYEDVIQFSKTQLKDIIKKNERCTAFEKLPTTLLKKKKKLSTININSLKYSPTWKVVLWHKKKLKHLHHSDQTAQGASNQILKVCWKV